MTIDIGIILAVIALVLSLAANLVQLVIILFLIPKTKRLEEIWKLANDIDKRVLTQEELEKLMKLKIYEHMNKCNGHQQSHNKPKPKEVPA